MKESTNREKVLKNIRDAIIDKSDNPFQNIDFESSVFHENSDTLDITFAEAFNEVYGSFVYCTDEREFLNNFNFIASDKKWNNIYCIDDDLIDLLQLSKIKFSTDNAGFLQHKVGITKCEYLIARSGSIMVSSRQMSGRKMNFYADTHVVVAYTSQLVDDLKHALKLIRTKYPSLPSMISIICGPSKNMDIENTLIIGSHGPKEVFLFLIDDSQ